MSATEAQKYAEWLKAHGVDRTPDDRRATIRMQLNALEKQIERRRQNIKHAPTERDADKARERLDALQDQAMRLEAELHVPDGPIGFCNRCDAEIYEKKDHDYGVCGRCKFPSNERGVSS